MAKDKKSNKKERRFALNLGIVNGHAKTNMMYEYCNISDLSIALAFLEIHKNELLDRLKILMSKSKK